MKKKFESKRDPWILLADNKRYIVPKFKGKSMERYQKRLKAWEKRRKMDEVNDE